MLHSVNYSMEEKNDFWEDLDGLIESISKEERIVLGADLNGHVGEGNIGDEEIMGRYSAGTRNKEGSMVVDFGKRMNEKEEGSMVVDFGKISIDDCQYLFQEER